MNYFLVAIGSAFGGALRYWLSSFVYKFLPANFSYGTLSVNIIGSFILGILMYFMNDRELISPELRLILAVGFCGGFTTFSTFSLETMNLLRDSEFLLAFINIFSNIILCLAAVLLAYLLSQE